MGDYCTFLLINETVLSRTTLGELKAAFERHGMPLELDEEVLVRYRVEKPVGVATIGDFGRLRDFLPLACMDDNETRRSSKVPEITAMLFDAIEG